MGLAVSVRNKGVDAMRADLVWMSLHRSDPGANGADEVTGGGYERQAVALGAASNGVSTGAQVEFEGVEPGNIAGIGYWSDQTGGTWRGGALLDAVEELERSGTVKVTPSLSLPA